MAQVLVVLMILGLLFSALGDSDKQCSSDEPKDEKIYTFGMTGTFPPYHYLNSEGQLVGNDVNILRSICKAMKKKCETIFIQDFTACWDNDNHSLGLYNRWFDVCVGGLQTTERKASLGFLAEYAKESANYLYVKRGSQMNTLEDVKLTNPQIGFINGWWIGPGCLQKFLQSSLRSRIRDEYTSYDELIDGLYDNEVEVVLATSKSGDADERLDRVSSEPIYCADAGFSFMMRKDEVDNMRWLETGLQKLRDNGDYAWLCNLGKSDGEPECFGVDN